MNTKKLILIISTAGCGLLLTLTLCTGSAFLAFRKRAPQQPPKKESTLHQDIQKYKNLSTEAKLAVIKKYPYGLMIKDASNDTNFYFTPLYEYGLVFPKDYHAGTFYPNLLTAQDGELTINYGCQEANQQCVEASHMNKVYFSYSCSSSTIEQILKNLGRETNIGVNRSPSLFTLENKDSYTDSKGRTYTRYTYFRKPIGDNPSTYRAEDYFYKVENGNYIYITYEYFTIQNTPRQADEFLSNITMPEKKCIDYSTKYGAVLDEIYPLRSPAMKDHWTNVPTISQEKWLLDIGAFVE